MRDLLSWVSALTLVCGFLSGVLAGLLGVGGAVLTTPVIRVLGATPIAAVGSTVPAILPGALAGVARYAREGLVDRRAALWCGLSGLSFAIVGALVAGSVDARWLMVLTAVLVLWSGTALLRSTPSPAGGETPEDQVMARRTTAPLLIGLGVTAGFLAGLLGIGGGIVLTPGLTIGARLPVRTAVATSLAAVALMSTSALITHIIAGHVDWRYALPLAIGIVPGARVGAHITVGSSEASMRRLCGGLLVVMGLVYLGRELAGLAG